MVVHGWKLVLLLALAGLIPWSRASAQHSMTGSVGADMGIYTFENTVFPPRTTTYDVDRRMTNQWLDINAMGPLVNGYFANYNLRARLQATQIRSVTDGVKSTEYFNPDVTNYFASVGLFPNRPFPLMVYSGRTRSHNIRYEASNRNELDSDAPGLAVLRRYQSSNEGTGAQWRYSVTPNLEFGIEGKTTRDQLERQYDFDENRNIWVDYHIISPGPGPYYDVEVVNFIPDTDVLLFINYAFIDTVKANSTLPISVEEGVWDVEFVPVGLNSFRDRVAVASNMHWNLYFNDPPGSKDLDQYNDVLTAKMNYGRSGKLTSDAYFEYNDGREDVQDMVTNLTVFNNLANYRMTPNSSLSSLTNYSQSLADVGVVSHNLSSNFMQQTTGKWRRPGSVGATLRHSYFYMTSETGVDYVSSRNNIVNGLVNVPTHWNKHEVDLQLTANLLDDSKGYLNHQYASEMRNRLEFRELGMRWLPRHMIKYSKGKQENPFSDSNEIESRLRLEGEHARLGQLGALKVVGDWQWRERDNQSRTDTNSKTIAEFGLTKNFGKPYKLQVVYGWEKETFGLVDKELEESGSAHEGTPAREPELRTSLRMNLKAAPATWLNLGAKAMWMKTNDTRIEKYGFSLSIKIPKLRIPIKTFISKENRELVGVRPQTLFKADTRMSYNIRQIRLVLSHKYTDETLVSEHYIYSEFRVKISRDFDIY